MNYSPWPDEGEHWRFEWRWATWMLCRPWYGANNIKYELSEIRWLSPLSFWFPFLSYRSAKFHAYLGWKPITLEDPAFYWRDLDLARELISKDRLFVQLSARWGVGEIS